MVSERKCTCCGSTQHKSVTCKFKDYKCRNCGIPGHIAKACTSIVVRDNSNNVTQTIIPKDKSITTIQKIDGSNNDRLVRTKSMADTMLEAIVRKADNAKEKRDAKPKGPNYKPRARKKSINFCRRVRN